MDNFELNNAVTLFTQQTTTINSLWTVYAAATFAAAGYGLSAKSLPGMVAAAVTIGFLLFAAGNLSLLHQALGISLQLKADITGFMATHPGGNDFKGSIDKLMATANPPWISITIHALIDLCVLVSIWWRVRSPAQMTT